MSHAGVERGSARPWTDRAFEAIPLAPIWVSAVLALALIGLFVLIVSVTGDFAEFMKRDTRWWEERDPRLAILIALLTAYLPSARRYEEIGTRRNLEVLRTAIRWPPGGFEESRRSCLAIDPGRQRFAGLLSMLGVPLTALLVDRDPTLYLLAEYWGPAQFWIWGIGFLLCWNAGILVYAVSRHARGFSRLARSLAGVDLLDPDRYAPFARQGLRAALPGLIFLAFLAPNLVDRGWFWAIAVFGSVAVAWTTTALLVPMRGIQQRIREAKRAELARVHAAIEGDLAALEASAIARRAGDASLQDLLAYRDFVQSVPEWPLTAPLRLRFLLYAAIPLGSWLGGALVERGLDAALR